MLGKIVCICGSTRFRRQQEAVAEAETLAGNVVVMSHVWRSDLGNAVTLTPEAAELLDVVHRRKIAMSEVVVFVTPPRFRCAVCQKWFDRPDEKCGCLGPVLCQPYAGDSTTSELLYARELGKKIVHVLSPEKHRP